MLYRNSTYFKRVSTLFTHNKISRLSFSVLVYFFAYLLSSGFSLAQISLNIRADTTVIEPDLNVTMVVANEGKESAHDVLITLSRGSETITLPARRRLEPDTSYQAEASLSIKGERPGRHPLFVTVGYTDGNGYPFSAILCATFLIEKDTYSQLFGTLGTEPLAETGRLDLHLKNVAQEELLFQAMIFSPREISIGEYNEEIGLGPREEMSLEVPLRNFSALPGSHYPIYAVLEYEKDGVHYTNVLPGQVEIIGTLGFFTQYRLLMVGAAGVLLILGIILVGLRSFRSTEQHAK
ncbi:hypothetical protein MYX82_10510 [Acidobacteria bacterium AH-259-D05]|nr:hypothetical protein [Acidobacteria bacterium AH-259-D05]